MEVASAAGAEKITRIDEQFEVTVEAQVSNGIVFLVGAGPGDPGLITVRGMRVLEAAEVVVYDYLANPELLQF